MICSHCNKHYKPYGYNADFSNDDEYKNGMSTCEFCNVKETLCFHCFANISAKDVERKHEKEFHAPIEII